MKNTVLKATMAICLPLAGAAAQTSTPAPMTLNEKFQLYIRQTYSVPSMLVPAGFAAIDQAADTPKEWGRGGQGYLNRLGTVRGQLQIGNFCAFGVGAALHEDPRFLPSGKHGMWRRTRYVVMHTLVARTDQGKEQPAFATYAGALGAGFFPATWLPPSGSSVGNSFKRSALFLGMDAGINMGIEFGPDDRRFFNDKIRRLFHRHRNESGAQQQND
jgi:hypothetical protein